MIGQWNLKRVITLCLCYRLFCLYFSDYPEAVFYCLRKLNSNSFENFRLLSSKNVLISGKQDLGVVDEIEKILEGGYLEGAERRTPRRTPHTRAGNQGFVIIIKNKNTNSLRRNRNE